MYTEKIDKALRKAALLHKNQTRKGKDEVPYITHLVGVMLIVSKYTEDEDVLCAALLHDSVEDTDYTFEEMKEEFGVKVAEVVSGVTESREFSDWRERKENYLKNLLAAREESSLIAAADKTHNFHSAIVDFDHDKEGFRKRFEGNFDDRLGMYEEIVRQISTRIPEGLQTELEKSLKEYKMFLQE